MSFDPTKPVQLEDGAKAGIYDAKTGGDYPIHGWYESAGERFSECWTIDGDSCHSVGQLVNVPDYPPLPNVEGGRLEYRGMKWTGESCELWICGGCPRSEWHSLGKAIPIGANIHYAEFIPDAPTTVRGWIDTLPEGYRERAVLMVKDGDEPATTLKRAVASLSSWDCAPEGRVFWLAISNGALPPLPPKAELVPYTVETFPMWAVWMRPKQKSFRWAISETCSVGLKPSTGSVRDYADALESYEIAGVDGEWHPAGQEVSK